MDQTLHVLVLVGGQTEGRHVTRLLEHTSAVVEVTSQLTGAHVSFARHLGDVAVLVAPQDPFEAIFSLAGLGIDLPIVVIRDDDSRWSDAELLASGAKACVALPSSPSGIMELLHAAAKEAPLSARDQLLRELIMDPVVHTVRYRGAVVTLSRREYALLDCLISRPGRPTSIQRLQAHAWGQELPPKSASQIVTVYVHQLRRKLGPVGLADTIRTVRGFGYTFVAPGEREGRRQYGIKQDCDAPAV